MAGFSFRAGRISGTTVRYASSAVRVNSILTADVAITPTGGWAAGADDVGRLGGGVHLARPGERMEPTRLRLAGHADGPHGRGAVGGARPSGGLGAGRRAAQRGGRGRRRDASPLSAPWSPRPAWNLPDRRDLPAAA